MTPRRDAAAGSEADFQPGSRGRVLRNFLGITKVREMEEAETRALIAAQRAARTTYERNHRFTPADIRRLHRMWLGSIPGDPVRVPGVQNGQFDRTDRYD
jgi:cell filamentation protein